MRRDPMLKGSLDPRHALDVYRYNKEFRRSHPDWYPYTGITVFCGPQGSGKTLSAVQYVIRLAERYPRSILVSNVDIKGLPEDYTVIPYDGIKSLTCINNGEYGVIYLIDEIHLEFNSLDSKSIPLEVFAEISQQRKQRKHIIATSQLFLRLAKPFREQASRVVICNTHLGCLQHNICYDGASLVEDKDGFAGDVLGHYLWLHSPQLYGRYDTYAKIRRYAEAWQRGNIGRIAVSDYAVPGLPRDGGEPR